mgnify:CR=1 FL=1
MLNPVLFLYFLAISSRVASEIGFNPSIKRLVIRGINSITAPISGEVVTKNAKAGDKIEIREKSKSLQRYKDIIAATEGHLVPGWLTADRENLCGEVVEKPNREQIDVPVNETLIVELYSK